MVARKAARSRSFIRTLMLAAGLFVTAVIPRAGHAGPSGFVLKADALASLGGAASGGPHSLGMTLGQTVTGPASGGPHQVFAGFWRPGISQPVDVDLNPHDTAPRSFELQPVTPNPSRGLFRFRLAIPAAGSAAPILVRIFDVSGRLVTHVPLESRSPGWHQVAWDGRDDSGATVGLGVYFLRVEAASFSGSRRFVVIR